MGCCVGISLRYTGVVASWLVLVRMLLLVSFCHCNALDRLVFILFHGMKFKHDRHLEDYGQFVGQDGIKLLSCTIRICGHPVKLIAASLGHKKEALHAIYIYETDMFCVFRHTCGVSF